MTATDPAARSGLARRRGTWPTFGPWAGGAVLLLGLALVAVAVAVAGGVDLHKFHVIHGDGVSVHVVGQYYPGIWLDPRFDPFTEDRLRLLMPLAAVVYFLSVAGIGASLVVAIRGADRWPRAVRFLAGFLPGYLMVLAPLQILFAAVPTFTAAWIALVSTPVVAILLQRHAIAAAVRELRRGDGGARRAWLLAFGAVALIVVVCAVHRLQAGRYYLLPDSIRYFVYGADAQMGGALGRYLGQWAQQSDEWVFNAPLVFDAHVSHDQEFAFWSTQFVALASFAALIFGLVWSLAWRRRVLACALAVGLILTSTPAIHPWENVAIVGGQNPAFFLAHPGRQASVLAPWIALLVLGRWSVRQTIAILLAIAGLAFTTVDGALYAGLAVGCAGVWRVLRGRLGDARRRGSAVVVHGLALAALAAPMYVYYAIHHTDAPDGLGWVLVAGAVLAFCALALLAAVSAPGRSDGARGEMSWRRTLGTALAAALALATGFLLSNNMVGKLWDGDVRRAIGGVLPGFRGPLLDREVPFGIHFPVFTGEECGVSGHCLTFPYFLAIYGFTFVLALAGWVALGRLGDDERVNRFRAAWLATVAALALAFAILDFSGADGSTAWILTRFVEVPYYSILAFAAIVLVASRSRFTAIAGGVTLGLWTLIPFVHSHIPEQWVKNADFLVGVLH